MIGVGITERVQVSVSAPVPLVDPTMPPFGRMMSSKDAYVEAHGQLTERNGALSFDLLNGATKDVSGSIDKRPTGPVDIVGVCRIESKNHEALTITSMR
jgi:hypothetical protein